MSIYSRQYFRSIGKSLHYQFKNHQNKPGVIAVLIKPPLVGEHAFPLMGFVCMEAHVTFGGSGGIRSTARPELPYPCDSQTKSRYETSRRGK